MLWDCLPYLRFICRIFQQAAANTDNSVFGSGWRHLFRLPPPYLRGWSLLFVVLKKLQLHPPLSTIMSSFLTLWLKEKKESPTLLMISFTESSSWYFLPESATSWKENWKFKFFVLFFLFFIYSGIFTYFSVEVQLTSAFPLWTVCSPISLNGEPYRVLR